MEQSAIEWGIPADEYWCMTFREIMFQVMANKKRHEIELKEKAMFDYKQAQLNAYAMNDPQKMPRAEKVYPFLTEKQEEMSSPMPKQTDSQIPVSEQPYVAEQDKAIFMAMATAVHNHQEKIDEGGGDDGTRNA